MGFMHALAASSCAVDAGRAVRAKTILFETFDGCQGNSEATRLAEPHGQRLFPAKNYSVRVLESGLMIARRESVP